MTLLSSQTDDTSWTQCFFPESSSLAMVARDETSTRIRTGQDTLLSSPELRAIGVFFAHALDQLHRVMRQDDDAEIPEAFALRSQQGRRAMGRVTRRSRPRFYYVESDSET